MSRRTKLEFEPLSLEETARQLGISHQRAQRILALIGAGAGSGSQGLRSPKLRTVRHQVARKSVSTR